jgi:hypothetical protein
MQPMRLALHQIRKENSILRALAYEEAIMYKIEAGNGSLAAERRLQVNTDRPVGKRKRAP